MPQPGLLPAVISLKADGLAYRVGFTNPMTFFPAWSRALLIKVKILPMTGAEVEVPSRMDSTPLVTV